MKAAAPKPPDANDILKGHGVDALRRAFDTANVVEPNLDGSEDQQSWPDLVPLPCNFGSPLFHVGSLRSSLPAIR
jgi:hypothetical protein